MSAEQIDQITLHVKDLEESIAFFSGILGTKFGKPIELNIAGRKARLALSTLGLGLAQLEEPEEGLRAIGIKVSNMEELKAKLAEKGHKPIFEANNGRINEAQYVIYGMRFNFGEYKGVPISNRALSLQAAGLGLLDQ